MGGDYTRLTDQPHKRYAAVLMQQGRVQLDADWNEEMAILQRRWELQAVDTLGACAVSRMTPAAFGLTAVAGPPPDLSLGAGRLYVDGFLAEILDNEGFSYLHQPFYPAPPDLTGVSGPNGFAYLDVWEREVTYIEDPDLLEKALGGPDTCTRLQTVWQLKVEGTGETPAVCSTDLGALFPPSAGRLSSQAVAPPASDDPCIVPPGGGYRGLENRLYRIEIHTPGDQTTARFKWSRDDGSIVSWVEDIGVSGSATQLTVSRIGRDEVLRFSVNDWVEVQDDVRELMGEPGEMARVTATNEAARTITLDRTIPSAGGRAFGTNQSELRARHTRVRKWDQQQGVDANGLLTPGSSWISLEDGVQVQFSLDPGTGTFHVGDYWVFAARTNDGSVEQLTAAPPRGIIHHYCMIATLTGLAPGSTPVVDHDCRPTQPTATGCCCCTATVGDGVRSTGDYADIQSAVDALRESGGRICILPGDYQLQKTVVIQGRNLIIEGCGRETRIAAAGSQSAFLIERGQDITLEGLDIRAESLQGTVLVRGSNEVAVRGCTIVNMLSQKAGPGRSVQAAAIAVLSSSLLTVEDNLLVGFPCVSLQALHARIAENSCVGGGIWLHDGSARVLVLDNEIAEGWGPGIGLGGIPDPKQLARDAAGVRDTVIAGNRIYAMAEAGTATMTAANAKAAATVDVAATTVIGSTQPFGEVDILTIAHNRIVGCARIWPNHWGDARATGGVVLEGASRVHIHDNYIVGNGQAGQQDRSLSQKLLGLMKQAGAPVVIPTFNDKQPVRACGIFAYACLGLEVSDNTILDNGLLQPDQEAASYQAGIAALLVVGTDSLKTELPLRTSLPAVAVHGNTVSCPTGQALIALGLGAISVADNTLMSLGVLDQPRDLGIWSVIVNFGRCVAIFDLGRSSYLSDATTFGVNTTLHFGGTATSAQPIWSTATLASSVGVPEGPVLFDDNQVTLRTNDTSARLLEGSVAIVSMDDISLQDNQILAEFPGVLIVDVLVAAATVRAGGNRFTEIPGHAVLSCYSWGQMNVTTSNQATHCIVAAGTEVSTADNQQMITTYCRDLTGRLTNG